PLLGAALDALELLTPGAGFASLGRWLRSPFFQDEPARGIAAALEARLRDTPHTQIPFLDAYRHAGLRRLLHAELPDAARRLDAALDRLDTAPGRLDAAPNRFHPAGPLRSPAGWAALWRPVLDVLGGAS